MVVQLRSESLLVSDKPPSTATLWSCKLHLLFSFTFGIAIPIHVNVSTRLLNRFVFMPSSATLSNNSEDCFLFDIHPSLLSNIICTYAHLYICKSNQIVTTYTSLSHCIFCLHNKVHTLIHILHLEMKHTSPFFIISCLVSMYFLLF